MADTGTNLDSNFIWNEGKTPLHYENKLSGENMLYTRTNLDSHFF
jgi:hypothetical protein